MVQTLPTQPSLIAQAAVNYLARGWSVLPPAEAGLSRATFARRFTNCMGESPVAYLTRWRMGLAVQMLADSRVPLPDLAHKIGYESEFAFSRAFKRYYGTAPAFFRKQASQRATP